MPWPPTTVLFVCTENACRSQMAEAYASHHSAPEVLTAYSTGSRPSGLVNPRAIQFMEEVGIDLTTHTSKGIEELSSNAFDLVVTMGCGDVCRTIQATHRQDWPLDDPKHLPDDDFRAIRDDIEKRVTKLIASLS